MKTEGYKSELGFDSVGPKIQALGLGIQWFLYTICVPSSLRLALQGAHVGRWVRASLPLYALKSILCSEFLPGAGETRMGKRKQGPY